MKRLTRFSNFVFVGAVVAAACGAGIASTAVQVATTAPAGAATTVETSAANWAISQIGSTSFGNLCLTLVNDAYNEGAGLNIEPLTNYGQFNAGTYPQEVWNDGFKSGTTGGSNTTPPYGALVFYNASGAGAGDPSDYSHVTIMASNGEMISSNDVVNESAVNYETMAQVTAAKPYNTYVGWWLPDGSSSPPPPSSFEVAFQANTGSLYTYSPSTGGDNLNLGMMAGTSPSIAAVPGGYEIAFQSNTGSLYAVGDDGSSNLNLGMMAGTSPSIAAVPGGYEIAFQSNTGSLYAVGDDGSSNLNLGMMAGTSPSIAAVPGGYEIAFQSNTGSLYAVGDDGSSNLNLGMMAGTSPSIAAVPGGYEIAFQSNTGSLYAVGDDGSSNLNLGMMAGTSPSIAQVSGGYEIAFQANTGSLIVVGALGDTNTGLGVMSDTSPGISGGSLAAGIGGSAPSITSTSSTTFIMDGAGSFTVTATGTPSPSFSESGALPPGVTFTDNGNGTAAISGTSTQPGTYPFTITASNGVAPDATQEFTLTMNPASAPAPVTSSSTTSDGYWLVGSDGGIFSFGSATFHGSMGGIKLQRPVVGIVPTADRGGYWLDASDGGVFSFGDTDYYGSIPGLGLHPAGSGLPNSLNAPIVGMVASHDQGGYFMVASDGGVFAFGDAHFAGSCPGIGGCSGAAVAVMPDASGNGYWLVTATGHVYAFGDAQNYGAPGPQASAITSAVASPDGNGYYIVDGAGQVFTYGDAVSQGNVPVGTTGGLNPATAIFASSDNGGYWVADALGKVFTFGDALGDGDMSGTELDGAIIAATGS